MCPYLGMCEHLKVPNAITMLQLIGSIQSVKSVEIAVFNARRRNLGVIFGRGMGRSS